MKKILSIFTLFILFLFAVKTELLAQGRFYCGLKNAFGTPYCDVSVNNCDEGYEPRLSDNTYCSDTSASMCSNIERTCAYIRPTPPPAPTASPSLGTFRCGAKLSSPICYTLKNNCTTNHFPVFNQGKQYAGKRCEDLTDKECNNLILFNKDYECSLNNQPLPSISSTIPTEEQTSIPVVDVNALLSSMGGLNFKFIGANSNLGSILSAILPYCYAFAGVGLLILLIVGGFKYLTSSGDPKKTEAAKGTITAAVIGFIIVIVAYSLTQIVNYIFGLGVQVP